MLDHFGFIVRDLAAARRFYEGAMKPLGFAVVEEQPTAFILMNPTRPIGFVYIGEGRPTFWTPESQPSVSPAHYAFIAADRAMVEAFHAAGLASGGRDNGGPGLRRENYYAAFLLDPDGNNIEAGVREA